MSDKTEEATPKRLKQAQEKGDSARSQGLTQAVAFTVALWVAPAAVGALAAESALWMERALQQPYQPFEPLALGLCVIKLTAPLLLVTSLAAAAASAVQTGGVFAFSRLSPSLERLNPWNGVKQLFSAERLFVVVRALGAALFVCYFTYRTLTKHAADVALGSGNVASAAVLSKNLGGDVAWAAALMGLALGGLDYLVMRRAFLRRNRMSKDEVKREYRESEGDPGVKAARRRAHQEALMGSIVNAVKSATVVIVNPTHLASALRYDAEHDQAPVVVAQGEGELARRMIEAARAYNIPCIRDIPVARALRELEIGDEIPEALYEAVAEILRDAWEAEGNADDA